MTIFHLVIINFDPLFIIFDTFLRNFLKVQS